MSARRCTYEDFDLRKSQNQKEIGGCRLEDGCWKESRVLQTYEGALVLCDLQEGRTCFFKEGNTCTLPLYENFFKLPGEESKLRI